MKEVLLQALKEAMRDKNELKKNTITMLRAAILQVEKDEQKTLTEEEMKIIVSKEVKKRKESMVEYENAGREDIVEDLKQEIEILSVYLPQQLTQQDVRKLIEQSIQKTGATSVKDMGKVMQELRPKITGKADGKLVSDLVRGMLM